FQDRLAGELLQGIEGACAEAGWGTIRVGSAAEEAAVPVLLAIGYPHYYPGLKARLATARRVLWYGEMLPPPPSNTRIARIFRNLPSARALDLAIGAISVRGVREPPQRVMRWRERAAVEREWARNLRELVATQVCFDRIMT